MRGTPKRKRAPDEAPPMTRMHFAFIAKIIASFPEDSLGGTALSREDVAQRFATMLGQTNYSFNRERFMNACMQEEATSGTSGSDHDD